jgi:hypothetical protein
VERATPPPAPAPPLRPTPTPTSALPLYDDFNDNCLSADKWRLITAPAGLETPTSTPVPEVNDCLQTQRQFITEGNNGRLNIFLTLEGDQTHGLIQTSSACFNEAEIWLALNDVQVFDSEVRTSYLTVGLSLTRASGNDGFLEIRLEGSNASGRLASQVASRWTIPTGYLNLAARPYTFRQPIHVAFRVTEVGGIAPASANQSLSVYVNGEQLGPAFSMVSACGLVIGYHADAPTLLDAHFDEVRLTPLP